MDATDFYLMRKLLRVFKRNYIEMQVFLNPDKSAVVEEFEPVPVKPWRLRDFLR